MSCLLEVEYLPSVAPAQWRDKGEELYMPMEHAAYLAKLDYIKNKKNLVVNAPLELPKRRRGKRQNHTSDRAFPPEESSCLHSDPSSGEGNVDKGPPGPDLSQLLPLEWPDRADARKYGAEVHSPCDHLGRGLHSGPPHSGNLPRLARGSSRPGLLLWRPGAAASNRQRNYARLLFRPRDNRRQNIMATIPGPLLDGRPNLQELVLNDVVEVP